MVDPVPTPGAGRDPGGLPTTDTPVVRSRGRLALRPWGAFGLVVFATALPPLRGADASAERGGAHHRALSDDEITVLWDSRPVRNAAHRGYIFIDEEDIVEGTELPLYRVESSRYGVLRQLERMAVGDPGLAARIADLAPELARETEMRRREEAAFYTRRSGGARRDTPEHPDVVVGPAQAFLSSRR